jgi:hypothetical protein
MQLCILRACSSQHETGCHGRRTGRSSKTKLSNRGPLLAATHPTCICSSQRVGPFQKVRAGGRFRLFAEARAGRAVRASRRSHRTRNNMAHATMRHERMQTARTSAEVNASRHCLIRAATSARSVASSLESVSFSDWEAARASPAHT